MASDRPVIVAIGAGRMGCGIAMAFIYAGHDIILVDLKKREAEAVVALEARARDAILRDLRFLESVGALASAAVERTAARIHFATGDDARAAVAAADIIFEGVPETMDAKRECFAFVGEHARADAIVASTTSTIGADDLAALLTGPERFLNAHWLNPAYLMPLVELSPCAATDAEILARLKALLVSIGKVPVVCRSSPGYIVPRIQALAMNEAARLVEEGVASAEDVDTAIRVGFGLRFAVLGLLEFIDWGGGDILAHASGFLSQGLGERFAAPAIVSANMADGRRGLRDGRGFYDYEGVDRDAYRDMRLRDFVALLRQRDLMPKSETAPHDPA